jgi:hypothetical protein
MSTGKNGLVSAATLTRCSDALASVGISIVDAWIPLIEILRPTKVVSPCLQALGRFPGTSSLVRAQRVNVAPRLIEK